MNRKYRPRPKIFPAAIAPFSAQSIFLSAEPRATLRRQTHEGSPVRIDRFEIRYVTLPLKSPWITAYGRDDEVHSVLVKATSDDVSAWTETCPLRAPTYSPETAVSVFHCIKEFMAPRLVGRDLESATAVNEMLSVFKGNPFAKAGVESAWWVLHAQIRQSPLHKLLGGTRPAVNVGADFGVEDSIDTLLAKIGGAFDRGFPRVKLKVRPGWDLDMLRAVRRAFPSQTFHIDCNAGYTLEDIRFFREVDKLNLAMIEQPLFHHDLQEHAELQKQLETPVCLDESITRPRDAEWAIRLKACRYINIKPGRVGGLHNAITIHNLARDAGIPCWVGGMLESSIGVGILVELATLENFVYPNDICPSEKFYTDDLTEPPIILNDDCTLTPSSVPATPYLPVEDRIAAVTRHRSVVESPRRG